MSNLNVNNHSQTQTPIKNQNTINQAPQEKDITDFERAMQADPKEEKKSNNQLNTQSGSKGETKLSSQLDAKFDTKAEAKSGSQLDQIANKLLENRNANNPDTKSSLKETLAGKSQLSGQEDTLEKLSPDTLLSSLFSNTLVNTGDKTIAATQSIPPSSDVSELVDKLVERILVADTKNGTEIRISLNDGAIAGTEIKLVRGLDGQLLVNIASNNANSFQSLVAAQDSLKQALIKTNNDVRVEITNSQSDQNDSNNPNQRSRGYYEYTDPE